MSGGACFSQRHLAWFCVTCGKLPLLGSPRLLALGISGLFSVLTLRTDLDNDHAGRRRAGHAGDHRRETVHTGPILQVISERFRPTRQRIRASRLARLALRYSQDPAVVAHDGGRRRGHRIDRFQRRQTRTPNGFRARYVCVLSCSTAATTCAAVRRATKAFAIDRPRSRPTEAPRAVAKSPGGCAQSAPASRPQDPDVPSP